MLLWEYKDSGTFLALNQFIVHYYSDNNIYIDCEKNHNYATSVKSVESKGMIYIIHEPHIKKSFWVTNSPNFGPSSRISDKLIKKVSSNLQGSQTMTPSPGQPLGSRASHSLGLHTQSHPCASGGRQRTRSTTNSSSASLLRNAPLPLPLNQNMLNLEKRLRSTFIIHMNGFLITLLEVNTHCSSLLRIGYGTQSLQLILIIQSAPETKWDNQ